jgi:hypothetical protein
MRLGKVLAAAVILSAGIKLAAIAQETPAADSTKGKVIAPYNLVTDLSDDQKSKIETIHKAELAEEKKLKDKEHDDIMAVLTDDQKKALDDAIAKTSVEKRATEAEHRAAAEEQKAADLKKQAQGLGAATQP